nr:hypothetical protein [Tanacetum cinerariifolium]
MVKKSDGRWRMCVDFTDINKACPKDYYPLPEIDWKVLKSCTDKKKIQWIQEAEAALQEMKKFMEILPTLTGPVQGKILMMYLTASTESISAALFVKREEEQVPIYFVSRVLQGAELNYPRTEKLILTSVHAARRQVAKWAIELGEDDIVFQERGDKTPKDFLIEVPLEDNEKKEEEKAGTKSTKMKLSCEWKLFTDGAVSSNGSVSGLLPEDPKKSRKIRVKAPQYKLIRGGTRRFLWLQHRTMINGGQDHKARVLMAVNAPRCYQGTSRLREMKGTIRDKESCRKQHNNSRKWMAIQSLGS